jgi:alpha-1,2-mannosyltransferase
MAWDPLSVWPNERHWIWATLACWLLLLRGPDFVGNLQRTPVMIPDFFQEYASARNWSESLPIYANFHETVPRYLGHPFGDEYPLVSVNAHPPTSVLLAFPFVKLSFSNAFAVWNTVSLASLAASLWIVRRQMKIHFSAWSVAPLVALLLLCFPLWEQCRHGQLGLVLLLLVTCTWASERSEQPWLAGAFLGTATALTLSPIFLVFYYALRGRWKVVIAGLVTNAFLTVVSAFVLGLDAYRTYFLTVLPEIQRFPVAWNNDSLWGFWSRLFDPAPGRERSQWLIDPLYYSPALAKALSLVSSTAICGVLVWQVRSDSQRQRNDLTFGLAVTAMLLVSPICWGHHLLMLLVPLAVVWMELPPSLFARTLFLLIVTAFWMDHRLFRTAFELHGRAPTPVDSLGSLSYQFYALLGFFVLVLMDLRPDIRVAPTATAARRTLALGAVIMAALWAQFVYTSWRENGLFKYLGGDFGIYRSIAQAVLAEGPRAMYDLDLVSPFARELTPYYGPNSHVLNLGPGPYPAVYILPFLGLTLFSPPVGFLIWSLAGAALAFAVVRGMAARLPERGCGLIASALLFFPVGFALFFGQLTMLFLYGFYRAYRSLEDGRDFRAGLWCGALYLKPQYLVPLSLVFLLKGRWRALGGLALAGLMVLLGSAAIVGTEGLRVYLATLRSMSGFRDVMPIVTPRIMINWRGLLANFLPEDVSDVTGQRLTLLLSILTMATLLLIWRGPWRSRSTRFPIQMLATVIVMMLASYHNHIHSGALLLVPALAAAANKDNPRFLRTVLLLGLYVPLPLFVVTGSTVRVAWLYVALMLAALGIIIRDELPSLLRSEKSLPTGDASNVLDSAQATPDQLSTT